MPKIFSKEDETFIKEKMVKIARKLFSQYGLRKTSIADITSKVGIAQGTFYTFFDSKEELYFEIMEREEVIRDNIVTEALESSVSPEEGVKRIILQGYDFIEKNDFLRSLYEHGDLEQLMRKIPRERLNNHMKSDSEYIEQLINHWKESGMNIEISGDVISGFIRSLFLITFFKEQIGLEVYDDVVKLLAEVISQGIFPALQGDNND